MLAHLSLSLRTLSRINLRSAVAPERVRACAKIARGKPGRAARGSLNPSKCVTWLDLTRLRFYILIRANEWRRYRRIRGTLRMINDISFRSRFLKLSSRLRSIYYVRYRVYRSTYHKYRNHFSTTVRKHVTHRVIKT